MMLEILLYSPAIFLLGVAAGLAWSKYGWWLRDELSKPYVPIPPEMMPKDVPPWQRPLPPELQLQCGRDMTQLSPYAPKANRPSKDRLPPADWPSQPKGKLQRGW